MPKTALTTLVTVTLTRLRRRLATVRATGDRGGHAVEYAIGIGLAAAVILILFAAYQDGIDRIVDSWDFTGQ